MVPVSSLHVLHMHSHTCSAMSQVALNCDGYVQHSHNLQLDIHEAFVFSNHNPLEHTWWHVVRLLLWLLLVLLL